MRMLTSGLSVLCLVAVGCSQGEVSDTTVLNEGEGADAAAYVAASEPDGAIPVGQARDNTQDGDQVTLVGTVGGSKHPFVDGLAAFTIVDPQVPYCAPGEGCPTPWDYCCTQDQVKDNVATVKIVDGSGNPVAQDARQLIGADELSTVVAQGVAERDDQGNLTLAASRVFVRK